MALEVTDLLLSGKPQLQVNYRYYGLSTDTKPTLLDDGSGMAVPLGTEFRERDTGKSWYFDGSVWVLTTFPQRVDLLVELTIEIRDLLKRLVAVP